MDTYLPSGWDEGVPGGIASSMDPIQGGIVDQRIVDGMWFVVANNEDVDVPEVFATRRAAFDALEVAVAAVESALQARDSAMGM